MGERSARYSRNGRTTSLNVCCSWRIGMAAMSLGWPLMLASMTANAAAQDTAPPRVVVSTDRSVLPIPEPQYPHSTVFDARNATPPPRFEVEAPPNAAMAQEHPAHEWGYSGSEGPAHWGELTSEFATCKTGHRQSPVNIVGAQSADLPAIQFEYKPSALHIINNGHTIEIDYAPGSFIRVGDKRYELKQFHFHHPSEETIKNKRFPMEVHLVHLAADGNLVVVSVLLEEGSANPLVETLWGLAPKTAGPEKTDDNLQINVADLLPANRSYFTFAGSLTTPPCTEGVSWFVLKTPVTISKKQVATFAAIYPYDERPTQSLNGRTVLVSK